MYRFRGLAYLNLSLQVNPRPAPHVLPPRRLFFFFFIAAGCSLSALCRAKGCQSLPDCQGYITVDSDRHSRETHRGSLASCRFPLHSFLTFRFLVRCALLFTVSFCLVFISFVWFCESVLRLLPFAPFDLISTLFLGSHVSSLSFFSTHSLVSTFTIFSVGVVCRTCF